MRLENKFQACRHDDEVPLKVIMTTGINTTISCDYNHSGVCKIDNHKCRVVTYMIVEEIRERR